MQHMKNRHGLKKFKCNFCDYRSNDRKTLIRHENDKHKHEDDSSEDTQEHNFNCKMIRKHIKVPGTYKDIFKDFIDEKTARTLEIINKLREEIITEKSQQRPTAHINCAA